MCYIFIITMVQNWIWVLDLSFLKIKHTQKVSSGKKMLELPSQDPRCVGTPELTTRAAWVNTQLHSQLAFPSSETSTIESSGQHKLSEMFFQYIWCMLNNLRKLNNQQNVFVSKQHAQREEINLISWINID